jgi:hypothetical protein
MRRARLTALILLVVPLPVAAQGIAGDAAGFNVQRRVYYQGAVYEQTGLWYGASGAARLGPVRLGLRGLFGSLTGGGAQSPDVTVRATTVTLDFAIAPWGMLGAQAEARRFESDAGVVMWKLLGGNVRLEPGLGLAGLKGVADVSLLPASSVSGGPSLAMAVQATVGVGYSPGRSGLELRLGYRFERYDISASATSPERYEQFRGIVAEAGIRLGR